MVVKRRTPDSVKAEVEGTDWTGGSGMDAPHRQRRRKSMLYANEPVIELMDMCMLKEGVSAKRLEAFLGLGVDRIKDMRRSMATWRALKDARRCLWAMGYDLEVRVVKVARVKEELVLTKGQYLAKDAMKIQGAKKWDASRMWQWLGIERLTKTD